MNDTRPPLAHPTRRRFVVASASAALVAGCQGNTMNDRQLTFATLAAAVDELARLAQAPARVSSTAFTWPQTLVHCAQSIEYSMSGFPAPKPVLFQRTVGAAAFGVFAWRGRMSHDLGEPIPGAPALSAATDAALALERLRTALQKFGLWTGPLQPHFAYGALSQPDYAQVHAMHLANHFSAFRIQA